jgi:hypothetical protein
MRPFALFCRLVLMLLDVTFTCLDTHALYGNNA